MKFSNNQGFTLIEMLVSLVILVVLVLMTFVGITNYNKKRSFELASNNLVSELNDFKVRAISGVGHEAEVPKAYCFYTSENGSNNYILYADTNENFQFDNGADQVIQQKMLDKININNGPFDFCFIVNKILDNVCDASGCGSNMASSNRIDLETSDQEMILRIYIDKNSGVITTS